MKYAHDSIVRKTLSLKLAEISNASIFVSSFLNFVQFGVSHFFYNTQVYVQGAKWKKLLIDWNEYQENTASIGFQFDSHKLSWESCFTLFYFLFVAYLQQY